MPFADSSRLTSAVPVWRADLVVFIFCGGGFCGRSSSSAAAASAAGRHLRRWLLRPALIFGGFRGPGLHLRRRRLLRPVFIFGGGGFCGRSSSSAVASAAGLNLRRLLRPVFIFGGGGFCGRSLFSAVVGGGLVRSNPRLNYGSGTLPVMDYKLGHTVLHFFASIQTTVPCQYRALQTIKISHCL